MPENKSFFSKLISFEKKKKNVKRSKFKKIDKEDICESIDIPQEEISDFLFKRYCFLVLLLIVSIIIAYGVAEITYSTLHIRGNIDMGEIYWFNEDVDPEGHYRFDSASGYRLSQTPSRMGAVLPDGRVESIGILQGNDMGFQDDRDFKTEKPENQIRIAVLGDSYTFSAWTEKSWIRVAEERMNEQLDDKEIFLMNFAIDGAGLGNWASIIENIFLEKDLGLDGIIIASWSCDLRRQFVWRHDGYMLVKDEETGQYYEKRQPGLKVTTVHSWDPDDYPENRKDIMGEWGPDWGWKTLDSETVDSIEAGEWRHQPDLKPYLTIRLIEFVKDFRATWGENIVVYGEDRKDVYLDNFEEEQLDLIFDLGKNLEKINLPTLTFSFSGHEEWYKRDEIFAEIIGSEYISDKESGWPEVDNFHGDEIRIKNDGHWNDKGAYLFGETVHKSILDWILEDVVKRE